MEKTATYSISRLQKIFEQSGEKRDFLFVDETRYTPSTEEPFRTDTYAIAFIRKGSLRVTAGLHQQLVSAPALLTIDPSIIRTIERVETDAYVLPLTTISAEKFNTLYSLMKAVLTGTHLHERTLLRNYIHIILCEIDAASEKQKSQQSHGVSPLLIASISQVADHLNFADQSVFGKF